MRRQARLVAGLVVAVVALLPGGQAWAGCEQVAGVAGDLRDADLVAVATALNTRNGGRWATFAVEEVWKGDPGSDAVEVRSGVAEEVSPTDRSYTPGRRYLLFARSESGGWVDTACSATRPWSDSLAQHRPQRPEPPRAPDEAAGRGSGIDASTREGGLALPAPALALATAALLSASVLALPAARRGRRRDSR